MRGVSRAIALNARLNKTDECSTTRQSAIRFDVTITFRRSDFGLRFNVLNVGNKVALTIIMQVDASGDAVGEDDDVGLNPVRCVHRCRRLPH